MTEQTDTANDGGPAFARAGAEHSLGGNYEQDGMSLRDYFAGQAMQAMLTGYLSNPEMSGLDKHVFAKIAYEQADAMIAARSQERGQ